MKGKTVIRFFDISLVLLLLFVVGCGDAPTQPGEQQAAEPTAPKPVERHYDPETDGDYLDWLKKVAPANASKTAAFEKQERRRALVVACIDAAPDATGTDRQIVEAGVSRLEMCQGMSDKELAQFDQ